MAVDNPWLEGFWNLTAQGAYVRQYGVSVAQRTAHQAGSFLGATKPKVAGAAPVIERHWVIQKKVGGSGGGGIIGAGSSGDGPPS